MYQSNKSESLYDVISTIKSRCYIFALSVGQTSLDRFRCNNDDAGCLVICEAKESSALQLGDRCEFFFNSVIMYMKLVSK